MDIFLIIIGAGICLFTDKEMLGVGLITIGGYLLLATKGII